MAGKLQQKRQEGPLGNLWVGVGGALGPKCSVALEINCSCLFRLSWYAATLSQYVTPFRVTGVVVTAPPQDCIRLYHYYPLLTVVLALDLVIIPEELSATLVITIGAGRPHCGGPVPIVITALVDIYLEIPPRPPPRPPSIVGHRGLQYCLHHGHGIRNHRLGVQSGI